MRQVFVRLLRFESMKKRLDFESVCVCLYLSTILYRIRNKISSMKKYVAVLLRRWFRFPQL